MTLLILLAIASTAALSGVFGMAGGMVLIAVLALLLPIPEAMVIRTLAQGDTTVPGLLLWRSLEWRGLAAYALGVG